MPINSPCNVATSTSSPAAIRSNRLFAAPSTSSLTFNTYMRGFRVSKKSSLSTALSCASNSMLLTRFKSSRASCRSRSTASSCWYFLSPDFAAFVVRSIRRSTVARSVRASSAFRLSRSRLGSISP